MKQRRHHPHRPDSRATTWWRAPLRKGFAAAGLLGLVACSSTPVVPVNPTWTDVAPVLEGSCNGCHGWTAKTTGGSYRFDFYDVSASVCGDAALALDPGLILAGSALATSQMKVDLVAQNGANWPRMPPQPSPTLVDWERQTVVQWTAQAVKGPPPSNNHAPTVSVTKFPVSANQQLSFTAVIGDPDDDSVLGVVEVNGLAFLLNHPGAFGVTFDASSWPAGPQDVSVTLCDGWTNVTYPLGSVQIQH